MDILDEFDINIIKELEKDGRMAYSAIAANLKYQTQWCINASID
jgi:Lrp/AsnC family transcriptional regulator for asnA, asnC and gidA